jgi:hypothetical protein
MTWKFKIKKFELSTVLHRSDVQSAADANNRHKWVAFHSGVNDRIKR